MKPPRRRRIVSPIIVLAATLLAGAAVALGCSSNSSHGAADGGVLVFPTTFRQSGFQMVRSCRGPGEHSGLNGFTVWVNDAAAATYDQLLLGGTPGDAGGGHEMPDGAVVVKELYRDRSCATVDRWVAMKKVAGFDPGHGDWFWQDVTPAGTVTIEGRVPACSDCHEGNASCTGFGAVNGMDYLCTMP